MILVLNLGLKSIRAIIFDEKGCCLTKSSMPINSWLKADKVEQDAEEWREKLFVVVNEALKGLSNSKQIKYITVTCSASCLISIDKDMNPTRKVIMVSDKRASKEAREIANLDSYKNLTDISVSEYSQLSRILWIKNNEPEVYEKTEKFLSPNDYLIALLTGEFVTDTLNAEKFFYSQKESSFPITLYKDMEISINKLPEVTKIGTKVGNLNPRIASKLGLNKDIEVVITTYDAICSIFGTGISKSGQVCDVSGTVTSVRMYSKNPFYDSQKRVMNQYFQPTDSYLIGGSNNLGGGLIEWSKQCFYKDIKDPYLEMENEFISTKTAGSGLIFIPHLLGSRAPIWDKNSRGVFFGIERFHERKDFIRAIFESVSFSILDFLEIFKQSDTQPELITASGGLSQISSINQLKADVCGVTFHSMQEFESTSLGAHLLALVALGEFSSVQKASKKLVKIKKIYTPNLDNKTYYDEMYELSKELFRSIQPIFKQRQDLILSYQDKMMEQIENL